MDPSPELLQRSSQEMVCFDRSVCDLSLSPLFILFCVNVGLDVDSLSSFLASKGVVFGPSLSSAGAPSSSVGTLGPFEATPRSEAFLEVVHASISCAEILERFARSSGFFLHVSSFLTVRRESLL